MKGMLLEEIGKPLALREIRKPSPGKDEVLIEVSTCGVCRTDLHIADGDLSPPSLPLVLGHQIVGRIAELGADVEGYALGERVGVPWLGKTCGHCPFCMKGKENLCDEPIFTGYSKSGGFAEYCVADFRYLLKLPNSYTDLEVAPLLCAGLIGYRAYRLAGDCDRIGLYGFGSSAHLLLQILKGLGKEVYVFTRPGDQQTQLFAKKLGAHWVGGSDQLPDPLLDAALIFAPVGTLLPQALKGVVKGGRVISAGIHMSDIPSFPYQWLWGERSIGSTANLTRSDGGEFLDLAKRIPLEVHVREFPLEKANDALDAIRRGGSDGSCVLQIKNRTEQGSNL